jgi:hypothetical protein
LEEEVELASASVSVSVSSTGEEDRDDNEDDEEQQVVQNNDDNDDDADVVVEDDVTVDTPENDDDSSTMAMEKLVDDDDDAGGDDDDDDNNEEQEDSKMMASTSTTTNDNDNDITIDEELKNVLINELRYTKKDIDQMRPDIAKMVVHHKLGRPTEGMPKNWYIDGSNGEMISSTSLQSKKKTIVISVAAVGVVAAVSVLARQGDIDILESSTEFIEDCWDSLQSIPKAIGAAIVSITTATKGSSGSSTSTTAKITNVEVDTENEEEDEATSSDSSTTVAADVAVDDTTKAHSIKPGTKVVPKYDVDNTWLDKLLTNIENSFKGFFNMKI